METQFKYEVRIHVKNYGHFKFIGIVKSNSIKDLKDKARQHARSWNEHGGRLYLSCDNTDREWVINS